VAATAVEIRRITNCFKQGGAVWVWGRGHAIVVAIAGSRFDLLATLNGFHGYRSARVR
jgi:hypothetical protein